MPEQTLEQEKTETKDKAFIIMSGLTLAIGLFFVLLFLVRLFYPKTNLEIRSLQVLDHGHFEHGHVVQNEQMSFRVEICKITDIPVEIVIEMRDGTKDDIPLKTVVSHSKKGCAFVLTEAVIPRHAPLGEYSLFIMARQEINTLRKENSEYSVGDLTIVEEGHGPTTDFLP